MRRPPPPQTKGPSFPHLPGCVLGQLVSAHDLHRADELAEETEAYEREYVDDHSWEMLQEDEHGRLRPLVSLMHSRNGSCAEPMTMQERRALGLGLFVMSGVGKSPSSIWRRHTVA